MKKKLIAAALTVFAAVTASFGTGLLPGGTEGSGCVIAAEAAGTVSLADGKITLKYASYTYKGVPVTPDNRNGADELTVKAGGKKLTKGTDYTLTYTNNNKAGTATVTAWGKGKYSGKLSREFIIKPAVNSITSLTTGNGGIKVTFNTDKSASGYQILYSTDKTFTEYHSTTVTDLSRNYVNLTSVPRPGEIYYIKVRSYIVKNSTRYGTYSSVRSKKVLGPVKKITIPSLTYTYKGRALQPSVKVWDNRGNRLTEGTDYTYTISNGTNVGTATIKATGKGIYTGTVTKKFTIAAAPISKASVSGLKSSYAYSSSGVSPVPTLKYNSRTLKKGTDFTLTYKNNKAIGTATVTIKGTGNFSGSVSKSYSIVRAGWETSGGNKYYYYNNKKTTGFVDIGGNGYFFDGSGVMQTGWQEIDGGYYCFDRTNGKLYKSTQINGISVDKNGKAYSLTDYGKKKIKTMMLAHKIMLEQTSPADSMADKRYKVFVWEYSQHPYHRWRLLENIYRTTDEWDVDFANDIFQRGSGCCVSDACAAAYLFLEIGYTDIWVCHDTSHSWFTVAGKLFDPLFAEAKNFSNNYNADYTDYRINPVGKIRID